jgi:hypothetical protein
MGRYWKVRISTAASEARVQIGKVVTECMEDRKRSLNNAALLLTPF